MPRPTPLSDAITALHEHDDEPTYERLLQTFLQSPLGIIAHGLPSLAPGSSFVVGKDHSVSCGHTRHADGRKMLLACADLEVFRARFDRAFNAELEAAVLMNMAMADPECAGILINSATGKYSAIIDRATIERLLAPPPRKPWWKFW